MGTIGRMERMETLKLAERRRCLEIVKEIAVPQKTGITEPTGIKQGGGLKMPRKAPHPCGARACVISRGVVCDHIYMETNWERAYLGVYYGLFS